jgi:large subunit ribosomal protein L10
MPNPRKVAMLSDIADRMGRATVAVSADYRGLTVAQMTELRRALRPANCEVKVVKNTVAAMAAEQAGRPEMKEILTGPTALAIGFDDPVAPVKALTEHLRARRLNVTINGGWMEGQVLDRAGVESIASLPPKTELVAEIAGKLQSPLYNFAGLITASVRNLAGLIESRAAQLEAEPA